MEFIGDRLNTIQTAEAESIKIFVYKNTIQRCELCQQLWLYHLERIATTCYHGLPQAVHSTVADTVVAQTEEFQPRIRLFENRCECGRTGITNVVVPQGEKLEHRRVPHCLEEIGNAVAQLVIDSVVAEHHMRDGSAMADGVRISSTRQYKHQFYSLVTCSGH